MYILWINWTKLYQPCGMPREHSSICSACWVVDLFENALSGTLPVVDDAWPLTVEINGVLNKQKIQTEMENIGHFQAAF